MNVKRVTLVALFYCLIIHLNAPQWFTIQNVGFWPGAAISVHTCYQSAVERKADVQKTQI
jgi:hypothetical protein